MNWFLRGTLSLILAIFPHNHGPLFPSKYGEKRHEFILRKWEKDRFRANFDIFYPRTRIFQKTNIRYVWAFITPHLQTNDRKKSSRFWWKKTRVILSSFHGPLCYIFLGKWTFAKEGFSTKLISALSQLSPN